jgi:hypothetical protein
MQLAREAERQPDLALAATQRLTEPLIRERECLDLLVG